MALNKYVLTANVTVAAGTVTGDTLNNNGSASTPATTYAPLWTTTFLAGTAIVLDPAGKLFTAIGASNLRAFTDGTDNVGHAALAN